MRLFSGDEKSRPDFAADIREVAGFGVDVERDVVCVEMLLTAVVFDVVIGRQDPGSFIVPDGIRHNLQILIVCDDVPGPLDHISIPLCFVGLNSNFGLALLCPKN